MSETLTSSSSYVSEFLAEVEERDAHEPEFLQAVREVAESVAPAIEAHAKYRKAKVLHRMVEPERVIQFRVPWIDDRGEVHVNRGFRVQFSSTLGPYKGGLRFHPSVNLSVLKFLGFEQIFKNSLTGLAIGGAKGGSNFDPKGKSDNEVMRFCQSFINELYRHIGHDVDVPAGDIGVGAREIGYMFGQQKRLTADFTGCFTGKGSNWGGSHIRPEATGYGAVFFAEAMVEDDGDSLQGKTCLVSGSGNVAQFAVEKLIQFGARAVTLSDSGGFIYDPDGIDQDKLAWVQELKNVRRGRIVEYVEKYSNATFHAGQPENHHNPLWEIEADCAFPCATQNEINEKDARNLVDNGVRLVVKGANMPVSAGGVDVLREAGVRHAPGKASNAGGVAVSCLEMAQNSQRDRWSREEVEQRLRTIMRSIYTASMQAAEAYGHAGDLQIGANIAGFQRVADAMLDQGLV